MLEGDLYPLEKGQVHLGDPALDEAVGGLDKGALWLVGGRPAMGKSAYAVNLALVNAMLGVPVVLASAEETGRKVLQRMYAIRTGVELAGLQHHKLTDEAWDQVVVAEGALRFMPLVVVGLEEGLLDKAMCELWRMVRETDARLVIVDSPHRLRCDSFMGQHSRVGGQGVLRKMRWLAEETGSTVVETWRLSRAVEAREDKRPCRADLAGGRPIATAVDGTLMLYRPSFYDPRVCDPSPDERHLDIYLERDRRIGPFRQLMNRKTLQIQPDWDRMWTQ